MNYAEELARATGDTPKERVEVESRYPKRVVLRHDQPYLAAWSEWFENQYLSRCAQLGLEPEPLQTTLL